MSSDASERSSELLSDASDSAGDSDSDYEGGSDYEEAAAPRQRAAPAPPAAEAAAPVAAQLTAGADGSESEDSESESEDGARENATPQLTEYELERAARIEANKKRMAELVTSLPAALAVAPPAKRPRAPRPALRTLQAGAVARGSARLRGEKAPVVELDEHDRLLDASTVATTDSGELVAYSACHCCRQTTSKLKAVCTSEGCPLQWCLNCLANKEGVDAAAANESGTWRCPLCVGGVAGCLCSMCRRKAGRPALGPMWPLAQAQGFTSVRAFITARGIA